MSFRYAYSRFGEIWCLIPSNVHFMALTGTVTKMSYAIIKSSMGMVDCHDIIV